ncbi:hypothetical protein PIB30_115765, partial [Stylosanthes scabra]|nr:hypothetical protein [Stylosanthes scabra]
MANHKRKLCNFPGKLAPVQQQRLHDKIIPASAGWNALWSGDNEMWIYQVELYPQQLSVNLKEHT